MTANAKVGQAVAQGLATAARTVTIVVNSVDWSRYLDHAPGLGPTLNVAGGAE